MNKVILVGRLGKDPEIRSMSNGDKVSNLSLATSETWKDSSGERTERTEWHRVVLFGSGLVDVCERYLQKGSQILIEGKLQTRKWQDQSGQDRYSTEVVVSGFGGKMVMLGGRGGSDDGGYGGGQSSGGSSSPSPMSSGDSYSSGNREAGGEAGGDDNFDDDVPF